MNDHDAAGAYVVAALQPEDLDAFERHLARCDRCQTEVARLRETATELGWLAAAPPPPPGLRAAVLSGVATVAQLPPETRPSRERADEDDVVDLGAARRNRVARRTRVLTLLVAAVSVLALALGGVVVSLVGDRPTPTAAAGDAGLLSAPDARIVPASLPGGAHASFVVSRQQNRALFVAHGLPALDGGRTYQLWTVRGSAASPDSLLGGGADVSQWFHGTVADADALAVTVEPAGGSPVPTSPVLVSGTL
ncbi:anti-sigma factor [Microlunatus flavus]|uniref:Regulator of SigK n=1 Tax=Microlunatus flavus TaxID=1036181 RepID=A0A1H9I0L9_9ACTN|nr:anti-sigma factor [Microlunatus flavus]SEQ67995.1 Anti-sigma-K factor RskA [Microlunatus flavus]